MRLRGVQRPGRQQNVDMRLRLTVGCRRVVKRDIAWDALGEVRLASRLDKRSPAILREVARKAQLQLAEQDRILPLLRSLDGVPELGAPRRPSWTSRRNKNERVDDASLARIAEATAGPLVGQRVGRIIGRLGHR
jgi:hypothetical protein